jgi:hypothetical protein
MERSAARSALAWMIRLSLSAGSISLLLVDMIVSPMLVNASLTGFSKSFCDAGHAQY